MYGLVVGYLLVVLLEPVLLPVCSLMCGANSNCGLHITLTVTIRFLFVFCIIDEGVNLKGSIIVPRIEL